MDKLKFVKMKDNAKLMNIKNGFILNLPAGFTCPGANKCLAKAVVTDGKAKIVDGKEQEFRCFAAVEEARFSNARESRWNNFNLLKKCKKIDEMVTLISNALPKNADVIRVHSSGDFFNKNYFQAWMIVAELNPDMIFYAYTKSIHLIDGVNIPNNFKLNASYGGRYDDLIEKLNLKHVKVFFSEEEAEEQGYELDHTDEHAFKSNKSFGLLLHGSQRGNSKASKAWEKIRHTIGGYSRKSKINRNLINNLVEI